MQSKKAPFSPVFRTSRTKVQSHEFWSCYSVSSMRTLMSRRAASKPPSDVGGAGLPGLIGGRRVQFIPVMWRSALDDFVPPRMEEGEQEEEEHLDNQFGLEEIFGSNEKDSVRASNAALRFLAVLLNLPLVANIVARRKSAKLTSCQ